MTGQTNLTPEELAHRWAVSADHVRRLIKAGALPGAFPITMPGKQKVRWRIPLASVLAYESGRAVQAQAGVVSCRRRRAPEGVIEFFH